MTMAAAAKLPFETHFFSRATANQHRQAVGEPVEPRDRLHSQRKTVYLSWIYFA
jgi:hypothetical protein